MGTLSSGVILTAGLDRAVHVVALAELLRREGHGIAGIFVVTPFNAKRLIQLTRQRGRNFPMLAARRVLDRGGAEADDPLERFLADRQIQQRSLRAWTALHDVPYVTCSDLNSEKAVDLIRRTDAAGVLNGGGGILREAFIDAARGRILNAHHGPLPEIRGMNACEWSVLLALPPTVTIHVIDVGIDTGPVLESIPVRVEPGDDVGRLRSKCAVLGIEGLVRNVGRLGALPAPSAGSEAPSLQCFVMAPALREILQDRLARGRSLPL